jgi:hypothetical protein
MPGRLGVRLGMLIGECVAAPGITAGEAHAQGGPFGGWRHTLCADVGSWLYPLDPAPMRAGFPVRFTSLNDTLLAITDFRRCSG